jgi:hypothetical protein
MSHDCCLYHINVLHAQTLEKLCIVTERYIPAFQGICPTMSLTTKNKCGPRQTVRYVFAVYLQAPALEEVYLPITSPPGQLPDMVSR